MDVNKLRHPLMTETTARFAHLLKTGDQMNDHHEHEQDEGVMSVEEAVAELADSVSVLLMAFELITLSSFALLKECSTFVGLDQSKVLIPEKIILIFNNYSLKWRRLLVDIYQAAKR